MVKYLFIDNFRGFTKTLLPIKDVDFLVGENSTGKTSILALIKLLDTPGFWVEQSFNTGEVRLGNYKDIVSIESLDRNYFRVGLVDVPSKGKEENEDSLQAFLCTFVEEDGMPTLSHYSTILKGEQFHAALSARILKYKRGGGCEIPDDREFIRSMFLSWADSHRELGKGYNQVRIPYGRRQSLLFIHTFLSDIVSRKRPRTPARGRSFYLPRPFFQVVWLAPIRTRPQRTYDSYRLDFSPEGEHIPYVIKKYLSRRTREQQKQADRFIWFIEKFGRESGLFKSITVKDYDRRTTTSPFELDIVLTDKGLSIDNVGYGVSQALPLAVEIFARPPGTWFCIQQPEIHLHPRAQVALGDLMFELAVLEDKKFIVETHSDFMVDGFRLNYRRKKIPKKPASQILFFERKQTGNTLYQIEILGNGEISDDQPAAYREFFIKEQKRLLGL